MRQSIPLPDFSGFHAAFRNGDQTPEGGDVRPAFYLSYNDANCEYLSDSEIDERLGGGGRQVVSATFVTPYPPGFPVLVPGQLFFSPQILAFIRDLDTPEIHGYRPDYGYRVYTEKAMEIASGAVTAESNGHRTLVSASGDGALEPGCD